jgi:acyl-CoA synthetase (AMP-forming)/AMP-acid ligase II
MLEERWRSVVARHPDELAVHDAASGTSWSFAQLAAAADALPGLSGPIAFPTGNTPNFLLTVLRAWRTGLPLCPLETGQTPPELAQLPSWVAHLKLTSGTTGRARLVALTEAQIAADADQIVATMGLDPSGPNLGVISLAHSYGYSNLVTPLLLHGIPLILGESALPAAMAAAAAPWTHLTLPAVPALWRHWHEADAIPANLRLALSAGAALPIALERDVLERRGLKIHNFLGASECGGIAFDRSSTLRPDAACVGSPMKGVAIGSDETGCLVVQSPAVATGYWPEAESHLCNGRYRSSDLVSIEDGGVLWIRGRAGDVINVAGRKVSPDSIGQELLHHPAIRDCLAIGVPDDAGRGETVGLAYSVREPVTESDLRAFLARRLPIWQVPRQWWLRDDLGVDVRGKRSRNEWRRLLLGLR